MRYRLVIFTDLDGTLLDHDTYSFEPALPALRLLESNEIPLVICTSKTRAEIERYRKLLRNKHPFIAENGGAIFIPEGYFTRGFDFDTRGEGYLVIELGTPHAELKDALKSISRETGIQITGISEMGVSEIMKKTGLDEESAKSASKRDYGEPFLIEGDEGAAEIVKDRIYNKGYGYTRGGRFHHILGANDKGKAVRILTELYKNEAGHIETVGIGDSLNDLPMLETVDVPLLVQKPNGQYDAEIRLDNITLADGAGPRGWNSAILKHFIKFEEKGAKQK
ncbi:MAG: mannosyl-3-phosphoglycerate phosphatase [Deltaproteobacteria bacterium]